MVGVGSVLVGITLSNSILPISFVTLITQATSELQTAVTQSMFLGSFDSHSNMIEKYLQLVLMHGAYNKSLSDSGEIIKICFLILSNLNRIGPGRVVWPKPFERQLLLLIIN